MNIKDISHLKADDLTKLLRESTAVEIERSKSMVDFFLGKIDIISSLDPTDIEKIAKIATAITRFDGGCGGGCC